MSSSGLFAELKNHPWVLLLVILLHLGGLLLLGLNLSNKAPPMPMAQKHNIINAVVIDGKQFDERVKQKELAAQKIIEDKKAAEEKRLAENKRIEEKKQQAVEKKKLAIAKEKEQDRRQKEQLAKEKKAKDEQRKAKLVEEKRVKEKQAREKQEREQQEAKKRAEEKRLAEEQRLVEEQRKRRAEEKAEFQRALLEEEQRVEAAQRLVARTARLNTQRQQYIMMIAQKVENSWLRPVTAYAGQSCEVIVTQTMAGDVIDVQVQSCTSDNVFQRSVERAVRSASPLPLPPDPELFERKIYFKFKPR